MADRRLRIFHMVAKHGSFTRAAEALFMSQPAVTFQIRQLEERYQVRLFERGHGQISLTPAGELVLDFAERIIALSDEMAMRLSEMTGEINGCLEIGASTVLAEKVIPRILSEFNALYPQVRVRLQVANSSAIESRVVAHALDIGLVDGQVEQEAALDVYRAGGDELVVICAPDCPLAKEASLTVAQLSDYECLTREPGSGSRRAVEQYFLAAGVPPEAMKIQMELGSLESLKSIVATGLGYAIMSRSCIEQGDLRRHQLAVIPLCPRLLRRFSILLPKDRFRARLVGTFLDFAHKALEGMSS